MKGNKQRSSTARATAAIRAIHLLYDQPVVFNDPYALQFTSPAFRRVCRSRFFPWLLRRRFISEMLQPISAQLLSRAKYCEDKLEQAVSKGMSQYVIIGAGFDSFCVRRPGFSSCLRIYEIDHPTTQQLKKERIIEILGSSPKEVEFLAVDLEKQTVAEALSGSSFSKEEKAFFSWLGTVPYLSRDAVFTVFRHLASFAANGSEMVFDYCIPTHLMTQEERRILGRAMRIVQRLGEPVKSFFEPDEFLDKISHLGYCVLDSQSPAEQNERYFSGRTDGLKTHSAAYNMHVAISRDQ